MHDTAKLDNRDDATTIALRRAERFDMVVAMTLLVLLIFGWAIRLTPFEQWPRGDFQIAANTRHT
jgi:hypothetical protein